MELDEMGLKPEDAQNRDLFKTPIMMFKTFQGEKKNTGSKWLDECCAWAQQADQEPLKSVPSWPFNKEKNYNIDKYYSNCKFCKANYFLYNVLRF